jgi:type I restriction enzyme, S subunit
MGHANFQSTPINVPSVSIQKKTVARIYDILDETERLESIYQQKLAALEELKKSLLHEAFSGRL